jgi:transcriptional regulator with XRE-family HTH domain
VSAQILLFNFMADLPNRIRELRLGAELSQDALAAKVHCSKMQISELERGLKPLTVAWMRRIAKELGVTPGELLTHDDNPLLADERERRLLEQFRRATPEQRASIASVAEALVGHKEERQDQAA